MIILGIINVSAWIVGLLCVSVAAYLYYTWTFDTFRKQGIIGPRPWPLLGNTHSLISQGWIRFGESLSKYGKNVGIFVGRRPVLVSFDPEVAGQVLVKQFLNFTNRRDLITGDKIMDSMLNVAKDEHWKHLRNSMSPVFSTGKMKKMMPEINRCAKQLEEILLKYAKDGEDFDVKRVCGAYTMDVIASTAFGLHVDSQKNEEDPFVISAKKTFDQKIRPIFVIFVIFPFLIKYAHKMGIDFIPKDTREFFIRTSKQLMEMRESDPDPTRTDFLQIMLNKKHGLVDKDEKEVEPSSPYKGLSTEEIISNAFLFFLAGYETTGSTLQFLLYNLAVHPECQDRLVAEIRAVTGEVDAVEYDQLHTLPYLDQCINETVRLYPPIIRIDRVVGHDTEVTGIKLRKGQLVFIPTYAIHHDPKRWPDPENFNPDRFSPGNKATHGPYDFLPFGLGPRQCIAMRLALFELKMAAVYVLRRVKIKTCEKTVVPMKLSHKSRLCVPEQLIYLQAEKRN